VETVGRFAQIRQKLKRQEGAGFQPPCQPFQAGQVYSPTNGPASTRIKPTRNARTACPARLKRKLLASALCDMSSQIKERNMAHTTIADMTVDDLRKLIRDTVIQTLSEMLGDPDEGLKLRYEFKLELQRALATDEAGKTISAQEVTARLGLTW